MRIIFSRKGFDSGAGGCASPIVDGECISLPIPTTMPSPTCYADIRGPHAALVEDLTKGRISGRHPCHLDPDIDDGLIPRREGWRGSLGQVSSAQGHLERNGVGLGDLFLFWGLFRPADRKRVWVFNGPAEHRIFGWLQVGHIIPLGPNGAPALDRNPWLVDHPHVRSGWSKKNTLYIASDKLTLNGHVTTYAGWGRLPQGYRLSAHDGNDLPRPGRWRVPAWLNPRHGSSGLTYHQNPSRWDDDTVQIVSRGQEFVAHVDKPDVVSAWIEGVLAEGVKTHG